MQDAAKLTILVGFHRWNAEFRQEALFALRLIPCTYPRGSFLSARQAIQSHLSALSQVTGYRATEIPLPHGEDTDSMVSDPEIADLFLSPLPESAEFLLRRIPVNRRSIREENLLDYPNSAP